MCRLRSAPSRSVFPSVIYRLSIYLFRLVGEGAEDKRKCPPRQNFVSHVLTYATGAPFSSEAGRDSLMELVRFQTDPAREAKEPTDKVLAGPRSN